MRETIILRIKEKIDIATHDAAHHEISAIGNKAECTNVSNKDGLNKKRPQIMRSQISQ
jgi:hypothetical protein